MNIIPSSSTKLCISISKNPGISGSKFHNTGYNILNLNYQQYLLWNLAVYLLDSQNYIDELFLD